MVDAGKATNGFMVALGAIKSKPCLCIVNMLKRENTAYYPFTLSIANPNRLYQFYNGDFVIAIAVETDYVAKFFKSRGFNTTILNQEPWFFMIAKDQPLGLEVSSLKISNHMWGRLFAAFVVLEWLLTEIAAKSTEMNAGAESTLGF